MVTLHYGGRDFFFQENNILTPELHYKTLCGIPSDINEHLPTLKSYAEECDTVTEMGVRWGCATWAFIEGKPKKLTCIDIRYDFFEPSHPFVKLMCENYDIEFNWTTGDTLNLEIDETDLLMIDTLHTYNQLITELRLHHNKVSKYIILHDTTSFGLKDEEIYGYASDKVRELEVIKSGLKTAVDDFLSENKNWSVKEIFTNNNGLTVLQRND